MNTAKAYSAVSETSVPAFALIAGRHSVSGSTIGSIAET
jgi:hypothetical protein